MDLFPGYKYYNYRIEYFSSFTRISKENKRIILKDHLEGTIQRFMDTPSVYEILSIENFKITEYSLPKEKREESEILQSERKASHANIDWWLDQLPSFTRL